MSIHSCNDYIESLGYTLEDWSALTVEEQTATLRGYFEQEGLTAEEIEEAKTQLKEDLDKVREELEECADELDDLESGASDEEQEEIEELLEKLEALEEELDEIKDLTTDVLDDLREHNIDGTDGEPQTITNRELDGKTYTYTLGGGSINPFAGGSGAGSDREWLLEEGYINSQGEAIKEKDGVEGLTYGDIEAALAERQELAETQNIFINTGNQHWTLVSADGGNITFKVEKGDEFCYVTFTNAANAKFFFNAGLNATDLPLIELWPEWFLRNAHWGDSEGSPKSFWEELHPLTDVERYSAIAGYRDVMDTRPEEVTPYTDPGAVDEAQLHEIENKIFEYLDSGSAQPIPEFWADVLQDFTGDKSLMLQHLIVTFYLKSKTLFNKFFSEVILQMEAILNPGLELDSEPTFGAKIAILLLETQSDGMGQYDPTMIMTTLFAGRSGDGSVSVDGAWKDNAVNENVLNKFNQLIRFGGGTPVEGVRQVLDNETRSGQIEFSDDVYNQILTKASDSALMDGTYLETAGSDSSYSDGTTTTEVRSAIQSIISDLKNVTTVEEARQIILTALQGRAGDEQNDISCIFVQLLHDSAPDLLKALTEGDAGQTWANSMWALVNRSDPSRDDHSMPWNDEADNNGDRAENTDTAFANLYA